LKACYYIYYRVPAGNAERARAAVGALQRELSEATGIDGRLLRRRDDETTWMEIYEDVPDGVRFEAELTRLVERHGIIALLAPGSSRKQEVFRGF
jgi:8-oxo-dGTP pyrophosphatase MutT (NUDIX family)